MKGHRDLSIAAAAAVLGALIAVFVPVEIVRVIAALPLTLYLPGFVFVAASFDGEELEPLKRVTIEVAASLIVLVLGAFLLNIFPFGLTTGSWAALLALFVVVGCFVAARRRGAAQPERRPLFGGVGRPSTRTALLLGAAILVGAASIALAQRPLPAKHAEGYTALWMLPTDAEEDAVVVGVESNEQDPAAYRLRVVQAGGSQSQTFRVKLDPGEEKTFEVEVPRGATGTKHVVASLYREGDPGHLFRRVTRWLPRQQTFP
ncbi:MAG TPA: DUF1616 domain-containing protein [Solirubrobacterales bacterium]|nr:DUF1616 domain-containing protein [Solirubrobacterales bacterium]